MAKLNKVDFSNVILKSINPLINKEGVVNNDILICTFENPQNQSRAEVSIFKKDWDTVQVWNSTNKQFERYAIASANDDIKSKAFKYKLHGKNENVYYTQKDFIEALQKCVGKRVSMRGSIRYSVNNKGYLQTNIGITEVFLLTKEEIEKKQSHLRIDTELLFKSSVLSSLKANLPIEAYVGVQNNEYFKILTTIPYDKYLDGAIKDITMCNAVLDTIYMGKKALLDSCDWVSVPVVCEIEQGKGERQPTESDLDVGIITLCTMLSEGNEEKYKQLIKEKVDLLPTVPEEKGMLQLIYMWGSANNQAQPIQEPKIYGANTGNSMSATTVQGILEETRKNLENQAKEQANKPTPPIQNATVVEQKVEEIATTTPNASTEVEKENTNDDFPF